MIIDEKEKFISHAFYLSCVNIEHPRYTMPGTYRIILHVTFQSEVTELHWIEIASCFQVYLILKAIRSDIMFASTYMINEL